MCLHDLFYTMRLNAVRVKNINGNYTDILPIIPVFYHISKNGT